MSKKRNRRKKPQTGGAVQAKSAQEADEVSDLPAAEKQPEQSEAADAKPEAEAVTLPDSQTPAPSEEPMPAPSGENRMEEAALSEQPVAADKAAEENELEGQEDLSLPDEEGLELMPELPPEMRFVKRRKKRKHIGFWTFVAFTLVFASASAAFVFLLFNFSGSTLFVSPKEVSLPNFYGMDISDVEGNPEYAKFHFVVEENFNTEYDAGVIYAQSPKAPKSVKENATITLRVSKGVEEVSIPSVDGMTSEEAKDLLKETGLAVVVRYQENEEIDDGYAIGTDPEAGDSELAGNTVTLYVSREDNYVRVKVPNCVGKSESSARDLLQSAGFSVSVVEKESEKAAGTVLSQSPTDTAIQGSSVTIVVSKGGLTMDGGDHTHVLVATQVIPPTSTGYGYTVYTCEICGLVTLGDQKPPTG